MPQNEIWTGAHLNSCNQVRCAQLLWIFFPSRTCLEYIEKV